MTLADWIDDIGRRKWSICAKRLRANDTGASRAHQAGPYLSKEVAFGLVPELNMPHVKNPRVSIRLSSASHNHSSDAKLIWYNGESRDETRITGLGGSASPLLRGPMTGALVAIAIGRDQEGYAGSYWLCQAPEEEDELEDYLGPVEPGRIRFWRFRDDGIAEATVETPEIDCWLPPDEIPSEWWTNFPSTQELVAMSVTLHPSKGKSADQRLIARRECEYGLFRSIEMALYDRDYRGRDLNIDEFLRVATSMTNRRRVRAGQSLERQLAQVFCEEDLNFSAQVTTERSKRPDFLFPSGEAYHDANRQDSSLRMLGVKTSLKDRWRQVLDEADRIETKHLLTLQDSLTEEQFSQITGRGVRLVVPARIRIRYPRSAQPHILTLKDFIEETRSVCG